MQDNLNLSSQETAFILAGLAVMQDVLEHRLPHAVAIHDMPHFKEHPPLNPSQIEELAARIANDGDIEEPAMLDCIGCDKLTEALELYAGGGYCLTCQAGDPDGSGYTN